MSKVYLSGPITGLTYKQARFGWRKDFAEALGPGIEVLSPMRHEGHLAELQNKKLHSDPEATGQSNHFFSQAKMIVAKDFLDIEMSDVVVANFLGAKKVSIGTVAELGYAKKAGKSIIVVMEKDNIHNHPFVTQVADAVVDNLDDASHIVSSLLSVGV